MSWCAAYLFMILLLRHYQTDAERGTRNPILVVIPIFVAAITAFFMTRGSYLLNFIEAIIMVSLMLRSAQGLLALREISDNRKYLYTVVLAFCLIEYAMWTSSCFWMGDTIGNPYFWFNALLIVIQPLFIRAVRKAEAE